MTLTVWQFALAIGLPSAFTGGLVGLFFWRLQRKIEKRDAEALQKQHAAKNAKPSAKKPAKKRTQHDPRHRRIYRARGSDSPRRSAHSRRAL